MLQRQRQAQLNDVSKHACNVLESTDSLLRVEANRQDWQGSFDSRILSNGIVLGRGDFISPTETTESPMYFQCHIGLHIILDACYSLEFHDLKRNVDVAANQIWQREGDLGNIVEKWHANSRHRIVTIDFTPDLLARWAEDFALPDWLQVSDNNIKSLSHLGNSSMILARAQQILRQPTNTLTDTLTLESIVLQLCANTIESSALPIATNKIDSVVDIIRAEYMQSLTISELALRVGMNECYLKRDFKAHTGETIANYIRNLRMQEAMRLLLDENKTLQETAFFIGYKDAAYFSKVFKSHFGMSPKLLKTG